MSEIEFALDVISLAREEIASNVEYIREHLRECAIPEGLEPMIEDALTRFENAENAHGNDFTALLAPDIYNAAQAAARIEERFWRAYRQMHELVRRLDEYSDSLQFCMVGMLVKESAANMLRAGTAMRSALAHISRKEPPTGEQ